MLFICKSVIIVDILICDKFVHRFCYLYTNVVVISICPVTENNIVTKLLLNKTFTNQYNANMLWLNVIYLL